MSAMLPFSLENGITTSSWYAEFALRIRVRKSAIGSVMVMATVVPSSPGSPTPLRGAWACDDVGGRWLVPASLCCGAVYCFNCVVLVGFGRTVAFQRGLAADNAAWRPDCRLPTRRTW